MTSGIFLKNNVFCDAISPPIFGVAFSKYTDLPHMHHIGKMADLLVLLSMLLEHVQHYHYFMRVVSVHVSISRTSVPIWQYDPMN